MATRKQPRAGRVPATFEPPSPENRPNETLTPLQALPTAREGKSDEGTSVRTGGVRQSWEK
eukprot:6239035-Pyramimonas_sp.AAC.1